MRLCASLGQARIEVQVDVGYGDAVLPGPTQLTFPVLLNLPAPTILAYPRETVVAEKYHALVRLGLANSRMRDFHDLWALARQFSFEGTPLLSAVWATFERRQTPLLPEPPLALTAAFYDDPAKQAMWRAFLNRNRLSESERELSQVAKLLHEFLLPLAEAAQREQAFDAQWLAGGPWQAA